jgi:hypothetical protein
VISLLLQFGHGMHRFLDRGFGVGIMQPVCDTFSGPRFGTSDIGKQKPTKTNGIDTKLLQALRTGLLAICGRAIYLERLGPLHKSELGSKEDIVALSCSFEPFAYKFFVVATQTVDGKKEKKSANGLESENCNLGNYTRQSPRILLLAHEHDRESQSVPRRLVVIHRSFVTIQLIQTPKMTR